jgi:hypothetical protein
VNDIGNKGFYSSRILENWEDILKDNALMKKGRCSLLSIYSLLLSPGFNLYLLRKVFVGAEKALNTLDIVVAHNLLEIRKRRREKKIKKLKKSDVLKRC